MSRYRNRILAGFGIAFGIYVAMGLLTTEERKSRKPLPVWTPSARR